MCTRHREPRNGNRAELSAHRFWAEGSDKRPSTQHLRPNLQPIYHWQQAERRLSRSLLIQADETALLSAVDRLYTW
jgi:hypothetical protein